MEKGNGVKAWGQTWGNDPSAPLLLCEQASVLQSLRHVTLWRKGEERRNISCSLGNPTQANVEPELPHPLLSPGVPAQQELPQLPHSTAGVQLPWELRHRVRTGFGALISKSRLRRRGHLSKSQAASPAHSPQLEPRAGKLLRERNLFNSHQSLPFTLLAIADSGQQLLPLETTFMMGWFLSALFSPVQDFPCSQDVPLHLQCSTTCERWGLAPPEGLQPRAWKSY